MKYSVEKGMAWWELHTNFVVSPTFIELISNCKGLELISNYKYYVRFSVGHLFTLEEVTANLNKIVDAYIAANPNADKAEDQALIEFAEENGQYKFLKNYKR